MNIAIPDKVLSHYLPKSYIKPADEGEAIGIAAGHYLATRKKANVYISADGFMNALNQITSYIIPENIKMNIIISIGRTEPQHILATIITPMIIELIKSLNCSEGIHFKFVTRK